MGTKQRSMKIMILHTLGTGKSPRVFETYQVDFSIFINGVCATEFNKKFRPQFCDIFDPAHLLKSDTSPEQIKGIRDGHRLAMKKILELLDKYVDKYDPEDKIIIVGFDGQVQAGRLRQLFEANGNYNFNSYFHKENIDLVSLAMAERVNQNSKESTKFCNDLLAGERGIKDAIALACGVLKVKY